MQKVKKAIIPVAGYGTRFLPFTKALPKSMLPIVNIPAVQLVIQEAIDSGIEEIILIVGQHKGIIESHFSTAEELERVLQERGSYDYLEKVVYPQNMAKIHYVIQEQQIGTGNAVLLAEQLVNNEPFAVMFGDDVMQSETPVLKQGRNEQCGSATHTHIHRLNIIVCNTATRFLVQFPLSFGY